MTLRPRALLLDLEGTVFQSGALIPGAREALAEATRRGVAWRFVTNATSRPRSVILRELSEMGLPMDAAPERLFTGPRAARRLLLERGWKRCHFLVRPGLLEDFDGIEPVDSGADAVVLGDLGDAMSYERLNRAFRLLLDGAALVTLARNRYWQAEYGLMLDAGPFCAALEHASGKEAILAGKPSRVFFEAALSSTGVPAGEAAIVGDDLESDVGGGQAAGMRGILVRTGKFREGDLERSAVRPDAVIASVADLPGLLGWGTLGAMADEPRDEHEHESRVHESFDSLYETDQVKGRIDEAGREAVEKLRAAAAARDGEALRKGLKSLRDEHSWLYRELAAHPRLANLLDDLALLGL